MVTASVHEAKTHLSRYLTLVDSGEEVVIVRYGQPVARLVRVAPRPAERQGGRLRGQFEIGEDFYAHDPAIEALFNS